MITYRCEIQLVSGTTFLDIWNGFCIWRMKSKFTSQKEHTWLSENHEILKTETVTFSLKDGISTTIERFLDKDRNLFVIRYIQTESIKTFITVIITNLAENALSYTMEELPFEYKENKSKKFIPKPRFFSQIESFIDKEYVPSDFRGDPISFTPNIFVSPTITDECYDFLRSEYKHTANIRIDEKVSKSRFEQEKHELIENEKDLMKQSLYFITSKKNFDFVNPKLTWQYFKKNKI